ncbi:glycosyltransferase family 2 protein [Polaribacter sargassicola]|uniref:glycosyltransferase family 2 protein n=1 Tax=Polaribacter sargassicola TaxID=2836891 RepID=UPI001F343FD6|nr:glycosyltransferase [Polaribacter sp. DS7-9]MCG1036026.1 glycosyltransferase [Polaribacter sp. DS7-9]
MIGFLILVFTLYAILIIALSYGFNKVDEYKLNDDLETNSFSVIIPFRNEAKNLPNLLSSISKINYPNNLVEFILVDDDSTDNSVDVINTFCQVKRSRNLKPLDCARRDIFKIIKNNRTSNSPKKDAITTAILQAKHNWIVTTDADCILPKNWLNTLDNFIEENNPKIVVAPVNYNVKNNFLEQFQLLDFLSMQGTTVGGFGINFPFLCNGANLAYKKDEFLKLDGFNGNNLIASGDDIFLFEKFLNDDKKGVQYLKSTEAIVTTFPVKSWTDLLNQRTRWAAKSSHFNSLSVKLIGLLVLLTNFLVLYYLWFGSFKVFFIPFILKMIIDLCLFLPTIKFFKIKNNFFKWYILASLLYPFFSILVILKSIFFKYNWKGRNFKK